MADARAKTKAQMAKAIEEKTNFDPRDINEILDALADVVLEDLSPDGPGSVAVAGLVKIDIVPQPARTERHGRNPATGEAITIAARPALDRGKVRLRALKRLRDVL